MGCRVSDFEVEYDYSDFGIKPRVVSVRADCDGSARVYRVEFVG